jgi:thymidylate kinase
VNYCFLRNYAFLLVDSPKVTGDVDVLVSSEQLPLIDRILKKHGFFAGRNRGESKHISYGKYLSQHAPILALDFHVDDLSWYEVPYLCGCQILQRRVRQHGLFVPSDEDNLLMLLIHSSLHGGFKNEYTESIESILSRGTIDERYVKSRLHSLWHESLLQKVWKLALNREYQRIIELRPHLICSLLLRRPRHLARFLKYLYLTRVIEKMRPLFSSTRLVGFMGVDGSGKTTAANGLQSVLELNGVKSDIIYMGRWRNQVLPMVSVSQKYGMTGPRSPKKKEGLKFKIYCILRDIAYLMDMVFRYLAKLYPKMKKGYTVITDRYVYDLLLDNHCTAVCKLVVKHLFPKPSIVFHLTNDLEVIWQRKKELTIEEMVRQMKIFDNLGQFYPVIEVKSDEIDRTIDTVAQEYFCRLAS